jgi:hypothetical protein
MSKEFSIERAADEIYNLKTKEYFKEVIQSYINGNYRSAIVMLWTVIVCDLVFKLTDLRDAYSDSKARSVLEDIKSTQTKSPHSSEWELELLNMVDERLHMFTASEKMNLAQIQKIRHLSAHPIIHEDSLYSPTKDQARSSIRNALECLLLKPPLYSREIIDRFFEDIEGKFERGMFTATGKTDLFKYINTAYLTGMSEYVYKKLFETAWKFCFKTKNDDTEKNKPINLLLLEILYDHNKILCDENIRERVDFYKDINIDWSLENFVDFVAKRPEIFSILPQALKFTVSGSVNRDFHLFMKSFFVSEDLTSHIQKIREIYVSRVLLEHHKFGSSCSVLAKICEDRNCLDTYNQLVCELYINSHCYDNADLTFHHGVSPNLNSFSKDLVKNIIDACFINSQIMYRSGFYSSMEVILKQARKLQLIPYVKNKVEENYGGSTLSTHQKKYNWWINALSILEQDDLS